LIDIAGINTVPISMLVPEDDEECSYKNAKATAKTIGDPVVYFKKIKDADHSYFAFKNSKKFIKLLINQLQHRPE